MFSDHHRKKQQEKEKERQLEQEKLQHMMYSSPRMMQPHAPRAFSPRFSSPRHPIRSPGMRHEPYPISRPIKRPHPMNIEPTAAPRNDGQIIKIEPDENDEASNQSAGDSNAQTGSAQSPSNVKAESSGDKDDDNHSESSTGTIPNMPAEGLILDSDLSNIVSHSGPSEQSGSESNTSGVDPNIAVKLEALTDAEMELEITGVEPGRAPQVTMPQDWGANISMAMGYDPTGATGSPADMAGSSTGYSKYT